MSMEAFINTDIYGNVTLKMKGSLDYEFSSSLRDELKNIAEKNPISNITLDMMGMDFVGSSGIGNFVDTLQRLNKRYQDRIHLSNVKMEFLKVFKLYTDNVETLLCADEIAKEFDTEFDGDSTYHLGRAYAGRNRTFEN